MTPDEYEDILYEHRILRWSARILGALQLLFMFYVAFTEFREEVANNSPSPLITFINGHYFLAITLVIAFIGLIIAFWKEGLGGSISLACYLVLFFGAHEFQIMAIIGLVVFALPGALYVAYWWKVRKAIKNAGGR